MSGHVIVDKDRQLSSLLLVKNPGSLKLRFIHRQLTVSFSISGQVFEMPLRRDMRLSDISKELKNQFDFGDESCELFYGNYRLNDYSLLGSLVGLEGRKITVGCKEAKFRCDFPDMATGRPIGPSVMGLNETVGDLLPYFNLRSTSELQFSGGKPKHQFLISGEDLTLSLKTILFPKGTVYVVGLSEERSIELILQPSGTTKSITLSLSTAIEDIVRQAGTFLKKGGCRSAVYGVSLAGESHFLPIKSTLADIPKPPSKLWIRTGGVANVNGIFLTLNPPVSVEVFSIPPLKPKDLKLVPVSVLSIAALTPKVVQSAPLEVLSIAALEPKVVQSAPVEVLSIPPLKPKALKLVPVSVVSIAALKPKVVRSIPVVVLSIPPFTNPQPIPVTVLSSPPLTDPQPVPIPTQINLIIPPDDAMCQFDCLLSNAIGYILKQSKRFLEMEARCENGFYGASLDDELNFLPLDSTLASLPDPITDLWIRKAEDSQEHTVYLRMGSTEEPPGPRTISLVLPPNQSLRNITVLSSATIREILTQCQPFLETQQCESGFYGASLEVDSQFLPPDSVLTNLDRFPDRLVYPTRHTIPTSHRLFRIGFTSARQAAATFRTARECRFSQSQSMGSSES
jgi:hypothetical protein